MNTILSVNNLKLYYRTMQGVVKAVDDISFKINRKETLAIVGESGCGKSSLAKALIRLLPRNVYTYEGEVFLNGRNIMEMDEDEFRKKIRWKKISIVFQGALNSLNPVIKVGDHIAEVLKLHKDMDKKSALGIASKYLKLVGISENFVDRYPFELSGGMRQRVVIAMALVTHPDIIILDEPTSALDVITQASIINLLKEIKEEEGLTYIFITHDIALASELADKIAVFYAGQIVEFSDAEGFFTKALHPYAEKLLESVPTLHSKKKLNYIPGSPPSLINLPDGCVFHPRCPYKMDRCVKSSPPFFKVNNRLVRCWLYEEKCRKDE